MMRFWSRRRNWARAVGLVLVLGGALSYVPGVDSSIEFHAAGINLSFVFCLLGWGVWRCDHRSRRIVLVLLHVPVLLMGWFGYEAVFQLLNPDYAVGDKTLASVGDWTRWGGFAALVFWGACVPAYLLSDRKLKLLFEPSRIRKGLPRRGRESVKKSSARWTVGLLGGTSLVLGIALAAVEKREPVAFLDLEAFRGLHSERIDYATGYARECSRMGGFFGWTDWVELDGVKVHRAETLFGGIDASVWMEPAVVEGQGRGLSRFVVWPTSEGNKGNFERVSSLPIGYRFNYPVVYRGRSLEEDSGESTDVVIYRDWVQSPGSDLALQLVMVLGDEGK